MTSTTVDLGPLVNMALVVLTPTLTVLAGWIGLQVDALFKVNKDSARGAMVIRAFENGASAAVAGGQHYLDAHATVDVKNAMVAQTINYAQGAVGPTITKLGMSPATLETLAAAKLQQASVQLLAATSPVTPPAPAPEMAGASK